jgi:exodeoxyribonuclease VIII
MSNFNGKHFLSDAIYRAADSLANSDAMMIEDNPSDYVWSKDAPRDNRKANTMDIGTALHCRLLEPEKYADTIFVSSVKGRSTKKFQDEQEENKGKIVITQEEFDHIELMGKSVYAHPSASGLLALAGDCESSVFVKDKITGVNLKCRPDKDAVESNGIVIDVKTTMNLDDWRSDKEWINPLYKFNYGHQASFYTDILEQHYNTTIESFVFLVVQKSIKLGRYPVGVFQISRNELVEMGFWDRHRGNIKKFQRCTENNDWIHSENFNFGNSFDEGFSDDIEVTFADEVK